VLQVLARANHAAWVARKYQLWGEVEQPGVIYPKEETSEGGYDISLQTHKRLMKRGEPQSVPHVQGTQEKTKKASVATRNGI